MKTNNSNSFMKKYAVQFFRSHRFGGMCLLSCLVYFSCGFADAYARTKITMNTGTAEPFITADGQGFYGDLIRELFARIDVDAKVVRLPSARSIINANEGIDDGVVGRTKGMEGKYKNLIMIPVPILRFRFVAYSLDKKISIIDWSSLAPYSVGYIRGWYIYEKNLPETKSLTIVNNAEQLFKLLMNRRAELILFEYYRGNWWNQHLNANAHIIGSPVAENDMFIYMNKKHAQLVPNITAALKAMKKDGTYERIKQETLGKSLQ